MDNDQFKITLKDRLCYVKSSEVNPCIPNEHPK